MIMKTITKPLLQFATVVAVLTLIFRIALSTSIENHSVIFIVASALIYAIAMALSGSYFGKKDNEYLPIHDLGFRFHFTTYLIHNVVSYAWFYFGVPSKYETIGSLNSVAIIWGVFVLIHFGYYMYYKRDAINDLDKSDLFE